MNEDLKALYKKVDINGIFKDMPECKNCSVSCSAPGYVSWLLPEEVETYQGYGFNVVQKGGANFFKDGHCHRCEDGVGCTIYDDRSLECRITPLTVLNIDNEPHWVLLKVCPVIKNSDAATLKSIIQKVEKSLTGIENAMTSTIKAEIEQVCNAIETFENLKENIDYIRVKKLNSPTK